MNPQTPNTKSQGIRCQVSGFRCQEPGFSVQVAGFRFLFPDTWHLTPEISICPETLVIVICVLLSVISVVSNVLLRERRTGCERPCSCIESKQSHFL